MHLVMNQMKDDTKDTRETTAEKEILKMGNLVMIMWIDGSHVILFELLLLPFV